MVRWARSCGGSSPRLRGTLGTKLPTPTPSRFIPAPAGNTSVSTAGNSVASVHPRACGEHGSSTLVGPANRGSSPRLRGTHFRSPDGGRSARFIPAPAGNTSSLRRRSVIDAVHPRACGEHPNWSTRRLMSLGSSPRLRGTPLAGIGPDRTQRFIPAPAGNTLSAWAAASSSAVHPRACGEHAARLAKRFIAHGSSPRLRGTRIWWRKRGISGRFIPAPAGNTSICPHGGTAPAVHPRACGEHT